MGWRHARRGRRAQGARRGLRRAQVDARRARIPRQGRRQGDPRAPDRRGRSARLHLARARDRRPRAVRPGAYTLRQLRLHRMRGLRRLRDRRMVGVHVAHAVTTLRSATQADVPALAALARDSFVAAFGPLYTPEDLALFLEEYRTEKAYREAL